MMPNLDQIYTPNFFEEWGSSNERYIESARIIVDVLFNEFKPKRLVDVGCGCGVYSHLFSQKGVDVVAIDGVRPPEKNSFPMSLHVQDLTVPFENSWGSFDMVLCLEVAEHIPEVFADTFLDNLIKLSDLIILSAAQPNQGGHHHVNEQPKRYWVQKMATRGFAYNRKRTGKLMELYKSNKPSYMWMVEQISVYEKENDPKRLKADLPFSSRLAGAHTV